MTPRSVDVPGDSGTGEADGSGLSTILIKPPKPDALELAAREHDKNLVERYVTSDPGPDPFVPSRFRIYQGNWPRDQIVIVIGNFYHKLKEDLDPVCGLGYVSSDTYMLRDLAAARVRPCTRCFGKPLTHGKSPKVPRE